jgi:mono/diheme cytochrome c family protein
MKPVRSMKMLAMCGALALSPILAAQAAPTIDYGKAEFDANCAGCHGPRGKGDGHFAQFLNTPPSDLTALTRNNGKVFPYERVRDVIDGRQTVRGHWGGEMPIWGADYSAQARSLYRGIPKARVDAMVRDKINLLVEYIVRIQAK